MVAPFFSLVVPNGALPRPDTSWISNLSDSIGGAIDEAGTQRSFNTLADRIGGGQPQQQSGGFLSRLISGSPQVASAPMTAPVGAVSRGPIPDDYYSSIRSAESGGNDSAKNPLSSATGRYQFTTGTWNGLMQSHPELGLTADGRLDPNQQERAIRAFTQENAQSLSSAGVPVNPGNLYAAHFLGAGGANRVLTQADDAPISNYLDAGVVQANPFLDGMTVGQFKQWAASKGGNASGGFSAPSSAADAVTAMADGNMPSGGGQPLAFAENGGGNGQAGNILAQGVTPVTRGSVDPETIQFMLRNPRFRDVGLKLWAANAQGQNPSEAWQFINLPDGTLARANQQTGAVERIGQFAKPQAPDNSVTNVNGTLVRNADGSVVYQGEGKPPELTDIYDEQTGQPYKARYNPQTKQYERVGGVKAPNGMSITTNPDGTVSIQQGNTGKPPKLTEAEGKNSGFLVRANTAQETLNALEDEGTSLWNSTVGQIPKAGNYLRSQDAQKYDQAKRNFINAQLRRESGAVISPEEFANADQQYFPQPGDGPDVIAQKRQNRQDAIRGLEIGSGAGAQLAQPPAAGAPATGSVEDGYRFKGGDPANPASWEKVN